jgi:HEAT repeat protein
MGLAQSQADDVRESAIHALRTVRSATAIPAFVRALDDRVQFVRYDAVLGLAEVEHNWALAPSVDAFKADEQKYITAWKSWWQTNGQSPQE